MNEREWYESLLEDNNLVEFRALPSGQHYWALAKSGLPGLQAAIYWCNRFRGPKVGLALGPDFEYEDDRTVGKIGAGHFLHEFSAQNLYTSINRPFNDLTFQASRPLRNADIQTVTRIPFDLDPVCRAGAPSTQLELEATNVIRGRLVSMLEKMGWPMPALGCSGNGTYAIYRTKLPNSAESQEQLRLIYRYLQFAFSTPDVRFDQSVCKPGRILRAYGSVNRKGRARRGRPYRRAAIKMPTAYELVEQRSIDALANIAARELGKRQQESSFSSATRNVRSKSTGDYSSLDIVGLFSRIGLYLAPLIGYKANAHAVNCPWSHEHTTPDSKGDCVIYEPDGGPAGFKCKHAHCSDRTILDLVELVGAKLFDDHCSKKWRI